LEVRVDVSFGRRAWLVVVTGTLVGTMLGSALGLIDGLPAGTSLAAPSLRLTDAPASAAQPQETAPPSRPGTSAQPAKSKQRPVRAAPPGHDANTGAKQGKVPKAKGHGKPKPGKPK
jgi:hypothetical protein